MKSTPHPFGMSPFLQCHLQKEQAGGSLGERPPRGEGAGALGAGDPPPAVPEHPIPVPKRDRGPPQNRGALLPAPEVVWRGLWGWVMLAFGGPYCRAPPDTTLGGSAGRPRSPIRTSWAPIFDDSSLFLPASPSGSCCSQRRWGPPAPGAGFCWSGAGAGALRGRGEGSGGGVPSQGGEAQGGGLGSGRAITHPGNGRREPKGNGEKLSD